MNPSTPESTPEKYSFYHYANCLLKVIFWLMMNVDNNDTELGLALGYSIPSVQTRSNNNSGAGVNAGSSINIAFVASNPLSELVWSPSKGLSLKCADKKSAFLWDAGPSNAVLSPVDSVSSRGTNDDKPITDGKSVPLEEDINADSEVAKDAGLEMALSPRNFGGLFGSCHERHTQKGGNTEVNTVEGIFDVHFDQEEEYQRDNEEESLCGPKNIHMGNIAETSETNAGEGSRRTTDLLPLINNESKPDSRERMSNHSGRIKDVASGSQPLGLEIALASEAHTVEQREHGDDPVSNLPSPGRRHTELALAIEESKNQMDTHGDTSARLLEKMESGAENDLQDLQHRPGKEIGLSHTDVNERISKDDDDSRESMESCSSAALFSKGKKRWSLGPPMIVGSKKMKRQIHESPSSASLVRPDSSFMNWISNMVKGLPKSNQEEGPSLALSLDRPDHGLDSDDNRIITCNKTRDSGNRSMGFQTIFRSLYCPNAKVQEKRELNEGYPSGSSKELGWSEKTGADITQISCSVEDDKSCKQFLVKNENVDHFTSEIGGPSTQPWFSSANVAITQKTCKANSRENKTVRKLACGKWKDGISSSDSSLGKEKTESADNLVPKSDGKGIQNKGYRNDPSRSLWITRFSTKTPCLDLCRQSTCGAPEVPADWKRLNTQTHTTIPVVQKSSEAREYFAEDPMNVVGKELQNEGPSTESSVGFKWVREHDYQNPTFRLNPIPASQASKSSGAMASVFAKRLDALKHIISSDIEHYETHSKTTCFFCGRNGHGLRNCSEVKDAELEELLGNISSYDGTEEYHCLCIRCFQLDHWAITCPLASSSWQQQPEHGSERCTSMLSGHIICDGKKPRTSTNRGFDASGNAKMISDQSVSSLGGAQKYIASRSGEDKEENRISPLNNFDRKEISNAPKGMFDTIRRLRFSRADILKWMKSSNSLSDLDGFFVRLRLGKWEGGLGGTGYYVACITGMEREKSSKLSKNPIGVSVGGIKCLVESQYVSNHDFLEDELMAWWNITSKSGKIPTEAELELKFEVRKKLGF